MSAVTASFVLGLVAIVLMATVLMFALRVKGTVKASARVGSGSFDIETRDKRE
jgi:hypothetical protein